MLFTLSLLAGGAVAAGTYLFTKKKQASPGQSTTAAAITGAGTVGVTYAVGAVLSVAFWPLLVLGSAAAGGYYYAKRKSMKALPVGRS